MKTWHRSAILNQGAGGGGGGAVDENLVIHSAIATAGDGSLDVTAGDRLYAVTAFRDSTSTAVASAPTQTLPNQTGSWTSVVASTRFDTGGVSDGAAAVWYIDIDVTETVAFSESRACILLLDKGSRYNLLGTPTDTGAAQANTTPASVTLAAADYASAAYALFMCGYGDDARSTGPLDTTANFTPSPAMLDFKACGTTASGYDEDVFVGYSAIPEADGAYTFPNVNDATMYVAGGYRIWAWAFTLA